MVNNRTLIPAILLGLTSAVIACSSGPAPTPAETDRVLITGRRGALLSRDPAAVSVVVKAPQDKVLVALLSAYADLGIDVELYDRTAGQVGNRNFSSVRRLAGEPISKFLGCGQTLMGETADRYRVTMSLVSRATTHGADTNLDTWLTASARDLSSSSTSASCISTGTLENKLNELVLKHIAG